MSSQKPQPRPAAAAAAAASRRRPEPAAASAGASAAQGAKSAMRRPGIMAAAVAAVVAVGSLTGAQLKQDKQKKETIEQFRATEPAEQIRTLEEQRKVLMDQRGTLQKKVDLFKERVEEREQEAKKS